MSNVNSVALSILELLVFNLRCALTHIEWNHYFHRLLSYTWCGFKCNKYTL